MSRATRNGEIFQPGSWDRKILPEKSVTGSQKTEKKKYDIKSITVLDFVGFGEGLLGVLAAAVTQAADAQKEQRAFRGNWSGL